MTTVLSVHDLSVIYDSKDSTPVRAVDKANFSLSQGDFIGLVGESGSGKSTLGYALTRLSKPPARIESGQIIFDGVDIAGLSDKEVRTQRHGGFAMVLQAGMNALNPVRTVENHFVDIFAAHGHISSPHRGARARDLIAKVELPSTVLSRYPGELSGGMRQRVSIALALALEPRLMVFDEPTTALDVLVQRAVMNTIRHLQETENFTAILISHDLGLVLEAADRVLVMHEGRIVEDGTSARIQSDPQDPYTRMLLSHYGDPRASVVEVPGFQSSTPSSQPTERKRNRVGYPSPDREIAEPLIVTNVTKTFPQRRSTNGVVHAVSEVSFTLPPGASLGLVGASGSGKSTLAKMITGVEKPTTGSIMFGSTRVENIRTRAQRKRLYAEIQMVFQDPYAALNPLHTVEYTLIRPVVNFTQCDKREARNRVHELLETVGLTPASRYLTRLPHQLSGGQRQRVVIARALASNPSIIIADEPVSMLDVTLRAGVLSLLKALQEERGVSMLYITHDLLSARMVTDTIMVLNQGQIVESGDTSQVLQNPSDPYTIQLLEAIPRLEALTSKQIPPSVRKNV